MNFKSKEPREEGELYGFIVDNYFVI